MKTRTLGWMGTVALVAAGSVLAQPMPGMAGRGPGGPGGPGPVGAGPEIQKVLNLTEDQGKALRAALRDERLARAKSHVALLEKENALATALDAKTPDATAVGRLTLDIKAARDAQRKDKGLNEKALAVLTAEQKAKLAGLKDNPQASRQAAMLGLIERPAGMRAMAGMRGRGMMMRGMRQGMRQGGPGMMQRGPGMMQGQGMMQGGPGMMGGQGQGQRMMQQGPRGQQGPMGGPRMRQGGPNQPNPPNPPQAPAAPKQDEL